MVGRDLVVRGKSTDVTTGRLCTKATDLASLCLIPSV